MSHCAAQHDADSDSEQAKLLAKLLYETALLESGFQLADNKAFNQRVYSLVKDVLDIKKDITAVQEPVDDPAEVRRRHMQYAGNSVSMCCICAAKLVVSSRRTTCVTAGGRVVVSVLPCRDCMPSPTLLLLG